MKKFSLGMLVFFVLISVSYAGVNNFWQNDSASYGATCSNGKVVTVTISDRMVCTNDGNNPKCSQNWSPRDAATWACR